MHCIKFFLVVFVVGLFSSTLLIGQAKVSSQKESSKYFINVKYGIPLFAEKVPTYSSFETSFRHRPLAHVAMGFGYRFALSDNIALTTELSYEHGNFERLERYSYISLIGDFRAGDIRERFNTQFHYPPGTTAPSDGKDQFLRRNRLCLSCRY